MYTSTNRFQYILVHRIFFADFSTESSLFLPSQGGILEEPSRSPVHRAAEKLPESSNAGGPCDGDGDDADWEKIHCQEGRRLPI